MGNFTTVVPRKLPTEEPDSESGHVTRLGTDAADALMQPCALGRATSFSQRQSLVYSRDIITVFKFVYPVQDRDVSTQ